MANNRIYLRCKTCGDVLFLGKCFGEGYYYCNYNNSNLEKELNDFFEKHNWCINDIVEHADFFEPKIKFTDEVNNENRFDICYEFYKEE